MADSAITNTSVGLLTMQGTTTASFPSKSKRQHAGLDYSKGVEVHAYSLGIAASTDAARPTQLLTRPNALPLVVWCVISSASPLIFQSAFNGEVIKNLKLVVPNIAATGKEQQWVSYEATNALITALNHSSGLSSTSSLPSGVTVIPGASTANLEMITFGYEAFTMTNLVDNTVGQIQVVTRS